MYCPNTPNPPKKKCCATFFRSLPTAAKFKKGTLDVTQENLSTLMRDCFKKNHSQNIHLHRMDYHCIFVTVPQHKIKFPQISDILERNFWRKILAMYIVQHDKKGRGGTIFQGFCFFFLFWGRCTIVWSPSWANVTVSGFKDGSGVFPTPSEITHHQHQYCFHHLLNDQHHRSLLHMYGPNRHDS